MRIRNPHPPLDYDETSEVIRRVFDRQPVTINVYWHDAPVPFAGYTGWLHDLRVTDHNFFEIRLRTEPLRADESADSRAGFLYVHRALFLGAGEFDVSEGLGPLVIQTERFDAVIGGNVVPDWDKLQRLGRTSPETRAPG